MISQDQFIRTRRLTLEMTGIELLDRHHDLLVRRWYRLRHGEAKSSSTPFDDFLERVESGDGAARHQLIRWVTTQHTGFFRHPRHFDIAAAHASRAVSLRGEARLWSAATATGEEAYSMAMAWLQRHPAGAPRVKILATDIEQTSLEFARRAEYTETQLEGIDRSLRERFFVPSPTANRVYVAPSVQAQVEFQHLNLVELVWPVTAPWDVILCRNVLMYFEAGHRYAVLERMASILSPDGVLILDPSEHLGSAAHWFREAEPGVFFRRPVATVPRRSLRTFSLAH